jgi:hypothetical protein
LILVGSGRPVRVVSRHRIGFIGHQRDYTVRAA